MRTVAGKQTHAWLLVFEGYVFGGTKQLYFYYIEYV